MKKNIKKISIFASLLISSGLAVGVGVTYAAFAATDLADQRVASTAGTMKKSIFLDCQTVWDITGTEQYYAKFWNKDDNSVDAVIVRPSKVVSMAMTGYQVATRSLYVFEMDDTQYNSVLFVRANPNCTYEIDSENWWNLSNNDIWGRTHDIPGEASVSIPADYNYFHITGYENNSKYSYCTWKKINTSGYITPVE